MAILAGREVVVKLRECFRGVIGRESGAKLFVGGCTTLDSWSPQSAMAKATNTFLVSCYAGWRHDMQVGRQRRMLESDASLDHGKLRERFAKVKRQASITVQQGPLSTRARSAIFHGGYPTWQRTWDLCLRDALLSGISIVGLAGCRRRRAV